ncbi:MAG: ComEA family DNA-binding protein [Solirubrobacterales bacterium]
MSERRLGEGTEVHALERDVARERERAARSLGHVRRRLEQAESRAAVAADAAVLEGRLLRRASDPLAQELDQMHDEADGALRRLGEELERLREELERVREELDSERSSRRELTARAERAEGKAAEAEAKANELIAARGHEATSEPEQSSERARGLLARLRRPRAKASEGVPGQGASPEPDAVAQPEAAAEPHRSREAPADDAATHLELVNLNSATFEQLRGMGMSVTQATRVIAYRERQNGFDAVDDLDAVPGFPAEALARLKERLSA